MFQWKNLTSFIKTFDSLLTPRNQIPRNMMFGGKWMAYLSVSLNYWITLCEVNIFFHYFELIFIHVFRCMFDFWVFYPMPFWARSISITHTHIPTCIRKATLKDPIINVWMARWGITNKTAETAHYLWCNLLLP